MIVPDQKVIVGAFKCGGLSGGWLLQDYFLERRGVCTCRHSDA